MSYQDILYKVEHRIATITLNRPDKLNAWTAVMEREVRQAMDAAAADDGVRAIVLTGAGTRAFTAGLDLKELGQQGLGAANAEGPDDNPVKAIEQTGKPVIGAINGVAITGGFEVALACDVLIGSENARFADTHARVGIMPGWGLTVLLPQAIGVRRAREMSFTGNFMLADEALAFGLVNHVVPHADLIPFTHQIALDIIGNEQDGDQS